MDGPLRSTWKTPSVSSIMMAPPPSPRAKLAIPVSALIASDDQQPAGLSAPCAQFRKNLWPLRNHRPERDFWGCRKSFRNWEPGSEKGAGTWGRDEIRNITGGSNLGQERRDAVLTHGSTSTDGALKYTQMNQSKVAGGSGVGIGSLELDASLVVPTGPQNVPQHVWQPLCLYLGRPA